MLLPDCAAGCGACPKLKPELAGAGAGAAVWFDCYNDMSNELIFKL